MSDSHLQPPPRWLHCPRKSLELVGNNDDGSERGTVLGFLNHCVTAFGKRQLRQWVLFPLNSRKAILARLVTVRNLMALQDQVRVKGGLSCGVCVCLC